MTLSRGAGTVRAATIDAEARTDGESASARQPVAPVATPGSQNGFASTPQPAVALQVGATVITLPLEITIRLGSANGATTSQTAEMLLEKIQPNPDYSNRPGYDPDFLGFSVPLPKLSNAIRGQAFKVGTGNSAADVELKYYHYSVIFNKERRLAFVAAVNLDEEAPVKFKREQNDKWFYDPRVPKELQVGDEMYADNELDRGHLVRRDDASWGNDQASAKLANDDTFHFTNCSPQHEIFNQSRLASHDGLLLWGNLENYVAKQAKRNKKKMCVLNGPVFRVSDRKYRGVQMPQEFFKLVVFESDAGKPQAIAFVLSQASLIRDLPAEDFEVGPYQPFQVKIRDLESRTKLDFGPMRGWDPLASDENESFFESDSDVVSIDSLRDIVFAGDERVVG